MTFSAQREASLFRDYMEEFCHTDGLHAPYLSANREQVRISNFGFTIKANLWKNLNIAIVSIWIQI